MGNMRLPEGIMVNSEETFGNLKFQALHRVRHNEDEEGNLTSEVRHISYDLRSDVQGMTVTVILPGELPEKNIPFLTPVKLVNVSVEAIPEQGRNAEKPNWNIKADDIVPIDAKAGGDTGKVGAASAGADVGKTSIDAASAGAPQPPKKG